MKTTVNVLSDMAPGRLSLALFGWMKVQVDCDPDCLRKRKEEDRNREVRYHADHQERQPLHVWGRGEDARHEQDAEDRFGDRRVDDDCRYPVPLFTFEVMSATRAAFCKPIVANKDALF